MAAVGRGIDAQAGQPQHGLRQIGNRRIGKAVNGEQPLAVRARQHQGRCRRAQNVRDWLRSLLVAVQDRLCFLRRLLGLCAQPGLNSTHDDE